MSTASATAGYSYFGAISTVQEAHAVLEASKQGILPRVTRRLTDEERVRFVRAGAVFVWEEEEASIRRWTDHLKWSPSRVSGAFLTYTELPARDDDTLIKQSFSSIDAQGSKMHLIAYYSKAAFAAGLLPFVSRDPLLAHLVSQRLFNSTTRPPSFPSNLPPPRTLFPTNYSLASPVLPSSSFPPPIPTPPHSHTPSPRTHSLPLPSLRDLLETSLPPPRHHPFPRPRHSSHPLPPFPPHPLPPPHSTSLPPSLSPPHIPLPSLSQPYIPLSPLQIPHHSLPAALQLPSLPALQLPSLQTAPPLVAPGSFAETDIPFVETVRRGSRGAEDERQLGLLGRTF